jgi:riboflavin synthase
LTHFSSATDRLLWPIGRFAFRIGRFAARAANALSIARADYKTAWVCGTRMFTGIIEMTGEVASSSPSASGRRLAVRAPGFWDNLTEGASVAIDGVCLTLTDWRGGDTGQFDVIAETLARTTMGHVRPGGRVNLERSMRADARIDGHFVQGHVEAMGCVHRIERGPGSERWWFSAPPAVMSAVLPKGSIAVDGISLTVVDVSDGAFSVALIPTTLKLTSLSAKTIGDAVNLESDILTRSVVRCVERMLAAGPVEYRRDSTTGVTLDALREGGFMRSAAPAGGAST